MMNANTQPDRNPLPIATILWLAPVLALIVGIWEPRLMVALWFGISGLGMIGWPVERWMRWGGVALVVLAVFTTVILYRVL